MSDYFSTSDDLHAQGALRESLLLCGRYGSGKTCAVISLAKYIEEQNSKVNFFVIDIEKKFRSALESFGNDRPNNLQYRAVSGMNEASEALEKALSVAKAGDWIGIETLPRLWQGSQDLAYEVVAGTTKVEFLEKKRKDKTIKSPIPRPDDFWPIANGSQYRDFFDLLANRPDVNIVAATTTKEAKEQRPGMKESAERKAARIELGVNFDIEGAPRAMSYIETVCHLAMNAKMVHCTMLRDNLWTGEGDLPEFEIPDRKSFGLMFYGTCR